MRLLIQRLLLVSTMIAVFALPRGASAEAAHYFSETGHNVQGAFLGFFESRGGLDIFGYPTSEEISENGRTVQYFQRARFEWWPENPAPYQVQLGLLGTELGKAQAPVPAIASDPGARYFPETGHSLRGSFRDFWEQRGGLDIFGYPISEEYVEGGLQVQYFQRARLELHPANPAPYQVQLGLLGDELLSRRAAGAASEVAMPSSSAASATGVPSGTGGHIVFTEASGGGIYVMNAAGGDPQRIGQGLDASLSSDGTRVAYAQWDDPAGIYVMNADGSDATRVLAVDNALSPIWSPDGTKLAFYVKYTGRKLGIDPQTHRRAWVPEDQWKITTLDLATGQMQDLPSMLHSLSPSWAPDGQTIVYKGDSGLYTTALQGTNTTQLIPNTDTRYVSPVWSPSGDRLAFMWWQHDHWEIGVINPDGNGFQLLTNFQPFTQAANNVAPVWSPDGQQIAFLSDREGPWRIYVMSADGTQQRKISDADIQYDFDFERVLSWEK